VNREWASDDTVQTAPASSSHAGFSGSDSRELRMEAIDVVVGQQLSLKYRIKIKDAPPLMNGLRKCGIYTQWNFMQP
jgi:hypothetical protein